MTTVNLSGASGSLNFEGAWLNRAGLKVNVISSKLIASSKIAETFPFVSDSFCYDLQGNAFTVAGVPVPEQDLVERLSGRSGKMK